MMFSLNEHIEYLMMRHDCVVIPGWGALVAQYSESFYDEADGVIQRPMRKVGFNASVNHNDGLLAQSLVRRERLTYDQAVRFIEQSVNSYKQQLAEGGELGMGRLGFFHSDAQGHVEFIPFYHEMCNDQYFGLRSVKFTPLADLNKPIAESGKAVVVSTNWWKTRAMQTAASIVVLLGLSVLLTTPIILDRNHENMASLNLPSVSKPHSEVVDWSDVKADLAVGLPAQAIQDKNLAGKKRHQQDANANQNNLLLNEGGSYYLVISSLNNPKQVNAFLASNADIAEHTQVLHSGKYYRVCVARSHNQSHLYNVKAQLPAKYGDAWICHQK